MDLDALLANFFGTDDPASLDPDRIESGVERLTTALAVERDPGRKFALWVLLDAFGRAPDPETAFKDDPATQAAARDYAWAAGKAADKAAGEGGQ